MICLLHTFLPHRAGTINEECLGVSSVARQRRALDLSVLAKVDTDAVVQPPTLMQELCSSQNIPTDITSPAC